MPIINFQFNVILYFLVDIKKMREEKIRQHLYHIIGDEHKRWKMKINNDKIGLSYVTKENCF